MVRHKMASATNIIAARMCFSFPFRAGWLFKQVFRGQHGMRVRFFLNFQTDNMVFQKLLTVSGVRCFHEDVANSVQYEAAIEKLNSLQSNTASLEIKRQNRHLLAQQNVYQTERFLNKIGIQIDELDKLNVIHISGTKGKGSTSAFCESLLRNHGYFTGFYSSPHLVAVRERIRLNGKPISEEKFTSYFWHVYNTLYSKKEHEADMPAYFKFLTIMALYVFVQEKIDVAVVEVGIGGQHDCTNVFRNPVVCGITSLGIDHVNILGSTIDKIAWQKAGIFKPNIPAFTVNQPPEAMRVLHERAEEIGCPLHVVPSLALHSDYKRLRSLNLSSSIQLVNAALSIQLAQSWLHRRDNVKRTQLDDFTVNVLNSCNWPGRFHEYRCGSLIYFLDGAHTAESLEVCADWFQKVSKQNAKTVDGDVFKVLVFNMFGDRNAEVLLPSLLQCDFDLVAFCPNFAHVSVNAASDQNAVASSWESQMERCTHNSHVWMRLIEEKYNKTDQHQQNGFVTPEIDASIKTVVFPSICDVMKWVSQGRIPEDGVPYNAIPMLKSEKLVSASQVQVLVTGSLHLIGGFLSILDPHLTSMEPQQQKQKQDDIKSKAISMDTFARCYSTTPGTP